MTPYVKKLTIRKLDYTFNFSILQIIKQMNWRPSKIKSRVKRERFKKYYIVPYFTHGKLKLF